MHGGPRRSGRSYSALVTRLKLTRKRRLPFPIHSPPSSVVKAEWGKRDVGVGQFEFARGRKPAADLILSGSVGCKDEEKPRSILSKKVVAGGQDGAVASKESNKAKAVSVRRPSPQAKARFNWSASAKVTGGTRQAFQFLQGVGRERIVGALPGQSKNARRR